MEIMDVAAWFKIYDPSELAANEVLLWHWVEYFRLRPSVADRLDVMLPSYFAGLLNKLTNLGVVLIKPETVEPITPDQLRFDWQADPTPVPDAAEFAETSRQKAANMAATVLSFFG